MFSRELTNKRKEENLRKTYAGIESIDGDGSDTVVLDDLMRRRRSPFQHFESQEDTDSP